MIRRLVNWILHLLHIKKRVVKPAIDTLIELLPAVFAACVVIEIYKRLPKPHLSLPKRIWYRLKFTVRRLRAVIVGY